MIVFKKQFSKHSSSFSSRSQKGKSLHRGETLLVIEYFISPQFSMSSIYIFLFVVVVFFTNAALKNSPEGYS